MGEEGKKREMAFRHLRKASNYLAPVRTQTIVETANVEVVFIKTLEENENKKILRGKGHTQERRDACHRCLVHRRVLSND